MERFFLIIAHYIIINVTNDFRGSPASTSPCHSPPTRHVVLDHHHESFPNLPGLKLILGPSRDHHSEQHRKGRRAVQYRHTHYLRHHTLLQQVAEMVEPGHHHLHHRVRQGVQGEQQYLSSE